jgi:regulator of sigma E protease
MIDGILNILILLVILVALVLVHEVGHFVMAKRAGVKVHEFGIGFPPRAAVLFRRGETTYTLNWLPIGGFVRLEAEEGESVDPRAFVNQKLGTRLRILFAGVVVNFVVAWVIFTLIALFADPVFNVRIGGVLPDSPAQAAGLVPGQIIDYTELRPTLDEDGEITGYAEPFPIYDDSGDLILAIDGIQFSVFEELLSGPDPDGYLYPPLRYVAERPAKTVSMTVQRPDGSIEELEATLRSTNEAKELGALGVTGYRVPQADIENGVLDSVIIGLERTLQASTLVLRGVASLVGSILDGPDAELEVSGPVGIVSIVGEIRTAAAPVFLLFFVGLLSANLAVINVLPFPPMDGGRITMALVQAASRNRVSPAAERMVYLTGFVMLMALLVWVTISDISRLSA